MPYYCIQCAKEKANETNDTVFQTAFVRRSGVDLHAGICKSCAKKRKQRNLRLVEQT